MTIVVATLGSLGDLHPFLAVARALRERGHEVLFLSQEPHRDEVVAQGVKFHAIVSSHDHERTMRHPDLWHPIRGFGVLWRHLAVPAIGPTVEILRHLSQQEGGRLTVFASPLVVGARLARECHPFRLITGHTAPAALRSCRDPMIIGRHRIPAWCPMFSRRAIWRALDKYKLEPMAAGALTKWRHALALAPLNEPVFDRWIHSPDQVLGMFPPTFGPMHCDWPVRIKPIGFPLYEGAADSCDGDHTTQQLLRHAPSTPLVVFYPGSVATDHTSAMTQAAIELASPSLRCVFLGGIPEALNHNGRVACMARAHLPPLLRRAQVFVHHGGIGAIAQGMAAGTAQLILPSGYDQFDNAWRLQQINGAGRASTAHTLQGDIMSLLEPLQRSRPRTSEYSFPNAPNAATQIICSHLERAA